MTGEQQAALQRLENTIAGLTLPVPAALELVKALNALQAALTPVTGQTFPVTDAK